MRRIRRQLIVGGVGVVVVLGALTSAGSGAAPACNLTQLQLRDSTVNQGLGSYDRVVRGKETLVRMYFSMPSCHDNNDSIQITGGTLSATGGGVTLATGVIGTPSPVNTFPTAATYAAAPVNDSTADVKFVVSGSALAPAATTDAFTASFSATITFQYKTSATSATTSSSSTFTTFKTKTVEKKTNALRILVVPMGNAANSYGIEFPASAVGAVQNGMQTLSRLFPVPSGVTTLGATSGGIRYAIDSTLLNVGPLMNSDGKLCGAQTNFDAIKAQLAQFLVSWNTANPTAQADRVVGAISSDKSLGSASNCAEGMASVVSPEAWVRATPDGTTPSATGALLAMEIGHTFGLVPPARSFSSFHSLNSASDGTAPNRGYNVALRSFLADDRTAMFLSGTWNNNTTLLEKEDYAYLLCALGGQVTTECTTSAVAGTAGGIAALASAFAASGTTDGTLAGTAVQESFVAGNVNELGTLDSSQYVIIQREPGGAILRSNGVRVAFKSSVHDQNAHVESPLKGTFAFVVPANGAATKFELWKGAPGTGTLLWSTLKTNPPVISSFTTAAGGVRNFTNTTNQSEDEPALTSDANWIAYTAGQGITVAPTDRPQSTVSIPFPVQNGSTGNVVYSETSKIHVVTDPTGTPTDTVVFDGTASGLIGPSDPEFSPDLTRIVFSAGNGAGNRDIYTVGRFGGAPRRLTTHADYDTKPTWTPKGRIVFVHGPIGGGPTTELYSVRPDGTGETRLTTDAFTDDEPTASPDGNDIAWQRVDSGGGWEIYRMSANGGTMTNLTSALVGNALSPDWSPNGTRIAFHLFFFPFGATDTDVYTMGADGGTPFNATPTTGKSETNPKWAGDGSALLYQTGSGFETVTFPFEGSPFVTPLSIAGASDWAVVRPSLDWPAWGGDAGDGAHLAFVSEGDLYVVDVDLTGAAPRFGDPRRLYNGGDAKQPTISKDDSKVIFVVASSGFTEFPYSDLLMNDLVTVDGNSSFLTDGGGPYRSPSLSRVAGGDVLAVEIPNIDSQPEIWSSPILLSDPSLNFGRLLTDAGHPSWGADGRLAFNRGGDIWVWTPPVIEGPGTEAKVFDVGGDPSLAGNTYAFERALGGTEFPPTDIFIGSPGRGVTVDVQVTDDNPEENRLDLLVECPGLTYVGAVALVPTSADNAIASWTTNFDPSLTCENPTLRVAVSDGYNRVISGGTGQAIAAEQKPPTAAVYTPVDQSVFRQYELIPVRGSGWDPEDGTLPAEKLQWRLDGPGGFLRTGTESFIDISPADGGFPLGAYTLTLTVTDSAANSDTETRSLTVVGDADNDGMAVDKEAQSCITFSSEVTSADTDPLNAFRDDDGDGIVNVDDNAPCNAASLYEASIEWDPDAIEIGSQGAVTARVRIPYRNVQDVATAYIKSINGISVAGDARFRATQWNVAKGTGVGSAKFDRTALRDFFYAHGIANSPVRVVVAGSGGNDTWTFEGAGTLLVR